MQCELCEREFSSLTVHHLIPRQKIKRKNAEPGPTINLCSGCHRQIHNLFDNTQLAKELNTLEALKQNPEMNRFLNWARKQTPSKKVKVDRKRTQKV